MDTASLATDLDGLAVTWGLYTDSSFGPIRGLPAVHEEGLHHVCYNIVG